MCGTRPSPFARKFIGCRSFLDGAPRRFSAAARALRKPSSGPRRLTLHNAQSHLPDHVRHRRFLRRPRARPRLRRAGASSVPGPSLARPEDRLYRLVARRVARLFARARTLTAACSSPSPTKPRPSSPSARPRAARPPRRPPSRRRTSSARSPATPPRRRTAPSWRWPRRSACTPSARWPRRARTARASKAALRRRLRLRLR